MLRKLDEQQQKQSTANAARAAVMGATPEAQLAAQDSVNKSHANAVAEIASNASALKDQYLNNWRNRQSDYYKQRLSLENPSSAILANSSNQWAQTASNAFGAGGSLLSSGLGSLGTNGSSIKKTNLNYGGDFSKALKNNTIVDSQIKNTGTNQIKGTGGSQITQPLLT